MVLIAFIGDLGIGKTLSLVYLAYRNFVKGRTIYSNFELAFPFSPVKTSVDLENMIYGFCALDELWLWMDSRLSMTKKNRLHTLVLIKSRKRGLDIGYSTQHWMQIDNRVRNVTDFIAIPQLNNNETLCRLTIFSYPYMQHTKTLQFRTQPFFDMYDTNEEIQPLIYLNPNK